MWLPVPPPGSHPTRQPAAPAQTARCRYEPWNPDAHPPASSARSRCAADADLSRQTAGRHTRPQGLPRRGGREQPKRCARVTVTRSGGPLLHRIRDSVTGTPQGGIASPLLANIALSVLDEHFCAKWDAHGTDWRRAAHRKRGGATYRIVRYADDFVIMVSGAEARADALWEEVASVLAPLGLRLSETKSRVCHIDEGFDFLGFRIQRRRKRGTSKMAVYTYPSKKALLSIMAKVRAVTHRARHRTLADLLRQLNAVLRGWCNYFQHGVSALTFRYLGQFSWRRVTRWLRKRHPRITWKKLRRRFLAGQPGWRPTEDGTELFYPQLMRVTRYRWRAANIPTPWTSLAAALAAA